MNYEILPMRESDIHGIVSLENECFSSPWTYEGIEEELHNPDSHFLCANGEKIMGYIGIQEICGEAYITNIAVSGEFRRNGIARKLLAEACKGAGERKCEFITLEVRESNLPAISLYESEGFEKVGIRKNFYSRPTENGIIYTKFLTR